MSTNFDIDGLDNLNEVLSVKEEVTKRNEKKKKDKKVITAISEAGEVTLDDLNEVIHFETPVSEVMNLNE